MSRFTLYNLDCRDVMDFYMEEESVDAIVTDPPYGLGFMGKEWDHGVPGIEFWERALRVLKPGGYLLAFGGSRTYHRLVCPIEDAGFEVRDQIMWVYGSGFPKSHNGEWGGTALKPSHEPIVVARKPLIGTVEVNWREHGTGALNIEGCRVGSESRTYAPKGTSASAAMVRVPEHRAGRAGEGTTVQGRWPANLIHDGSDEVLAVFPDAKGQQGPISTTAPSEKTSNVYGRMKPGARRLDTGSAARFFYCAKASKSDRNEGLDDFTPATTSDGRAKAADNAYQRGKTERANTHPTVKPTELMRYLCRLVTPPGGVVFDPFTGSGSTGKAAMLEGFRFVGAEREAEYAAIAEARIAGVL